MKESAVGENCIVMEKVRHPRLLMKLFHSIINRFDLSQHVAQTSHNISPKWDPSSQESRYEHLDSLSLHLLHHTQLLSTTHMHTQSLSLALSFTIFPNLLLSLSYRHTLSLTVSFTRILSQSLSLVNNHAHSLLLHTYGCSHSLSLIHLSSLLLTSLPNMLHKFTHTH